MEKPADVDHPVHPLVRARFSPRAFSGEAIGEAELRSLFEAARWAPSANNEQPWRFFVARRDEGEWFERLALVLNEKNRRWAAHASVLVLATASTHFTRNGRENRHAFHDVGMATMQLLLQAESMGIRGHVMAGFDRALAQSELALPEPLEPVTMMALGRPAPPERLPEDLAERERAPRARLPQSELVFTGPFGARVEAAR